MRQIREVNIVNYFRPYVSTHMIPGTDFKFMLEFDDSQFVYLFNTETDQRQILIQGSPNGNREFPCAFFLKGGDGYELHFCTVKQEKGTTVHSWYRWFLGQDFFKTLKNYSRLPLEMNFDKLMKTMKHKDEVTKERDDMTFERNQKM